MFGSALNSYNMEYLKRVASEKRPVVKVLVLVIGGGSPMNELDLLMMSPPPVLLLIGCYHNISPLNYIDVEPSFMI